MGEAHRLRPMARPLENRHTYARAGQRAFLRRLRSAWILSENGELIGFQLRLSPAGSPAQGYPPLDRASSPWSYTAGWGCINTDLCAATTALGWLWPRAKHS